ncbi:flagellar assembly protein FliW [Metabacillus litoralis]|uniref:Flagellar assembly factor FliW n=1 Tax=Metabacillus litoralis TaxID=152268 RepID=A0A5C6VZH0_9BACI|nr:flagellar assembly protein FliW [Metabacillus litoralis]TXC90978.1 flagellar assembly protein FliW [Metabacillus litoralis]
MVIQTKYHGEMNLDEKEVLHFPSGIPGFLEEKKFVLVPLDHNSPFVILQSIRSADLGFVVVNPFDFTQEYEFKLSDGEKERLQIEDNFSISVYTILTLKEPFEESTVNLQGPIIINENKKLAKQIILSDSTYTTKHKLFIEKTAK